MTGTVSFTNDIARFGFVSAHLPPHDVEAAKTDELRYTFGYSTHGEFAPGDEVTFDVSDPIHNLAINVVKVVEPILPVKPFVPGGIYAGSSIPWGTPKHPIGAL